MEDYYKILEVNKEASPETIDKVYKMLVKKYHPDLHEGNDKLIAEEKIKKINEAFDVLSNPLKREEYNNTLNQTSISYEKYNELINENISLKNELEYIKNKINYTQQNNYQNQQQYQYQQYKQQQYQQQYHQQVNPNYYYTKKYQKKKFTIKGMFKTMFSILITALIIFICLNMPFIYNLINILFNSDISFLLIIILFIIIYISKK